MATVVLVFAGLGLAFTVPIARTLVDIFRGGAADWDPHRQKLVSVDHFIPRLRLLNVTYRKAKDIAIGIAVTAFYALDFALNA